MKNLKGILFVHLFVVLFFVSCGYQFEGGGYLKDDVTHVAVEALENESSETGAGIKFTNALIQEILQKTDTKVVDESRATAVLKGTLKSITFTTLSRRSTESVIERKVFATVDLKLINKDDDAVIWSVKDFKSDDDYTVSADKITDESNKREAVDRIAARSAEKLIGKMLVNF